MTITPTLPALRKRRYAATSRRSAGVNGRSESVVGVAGMGRDILLMLLLVFLDQVL